MLTRKHREISPREAKVHLNKTGWTYRAAAPELGVTWVHISLVLNGHRKSIRLLKKILELPVRPSKQPSASTNEPHSN